MSVKGGPDIVTDGLVFNLDAAGAVSDKGYPINGLIVEYLIVAGGGGGGGSPHGAGGGAGGLLHGYTKASLSTGSYTITVGGGGAGKVGKKTAPWLSPGTNYGANGGNSTAFGKTALGGGGGGGYSGGGGNDTVGKNGGSGGGTGRDPSSVGQATQPSSSDGGFGNNGGRGGYPFNNAYNHSGGGGGAGGVGYLINSLDVSKVSFGGIGKYFGYSFGRSLGEDGWFAGGGGGSFYNTNVQDRNNGGLGGGGRGGYSGGDPDPYNGQVNTGGGGGGAERNSSSDGTGGDGGSGVVIIRYKGSQKASGGDSIFNYKGFTVHVFTSSGTFTVGDRVGGLSTSKIVGTLNNMGSSNYNSGNRGYFTFDGTNEYIDLPTINVSTTANTVCAWARKANTDGGFHNIYTPWRNGFDNWLGAYTNKWFLFVTESADTNNVFMYSNSTIVANEWYFICSTIDTNVAKLYVNGELNSTRSLGFTIGHWNAAATIGRRATISNYYWEGDIASVRVYNYALPPDKILDNYNATKGRFGL